VRSDEYPRLAVRQLRPDWWVYITGDGIDRWVQVRGIVPARAGPWGMFCARDGRSWSLRVDPDRRLPASPTHPDQNDDADGREGPPDYPT
jgi:hypothetical protein